MSEELGKMEKPPVDNFTGARKLIVVPLVFSGNDAPQDFMVLFNRCWNQIREQIENLESKLGKISRIYHEMIFSDGEEGMQVVEQLNPRSSHISKDLVEKGAQLHATEDVDLATENMDWERCMMVAMGVKVRSKVAEFHMESSSKRYAYVATKIDASLADDEVGLFFVREGHRTQFPPSIEVFNVYPPAIDEINRWLRDYAQRSNPSFSSS